MATDIKDIVHAVEASAVMRLFPGRPRLLALGEPTHGEDTLLDQQGKSFGEHSFGDVEVSAKVAESTHPVEGVAHHQ